MQGTHCDDIGFSRVQHCHSYLDSKLQYVIHNKPRQWRCMGFLIWIFIMSLHTHTSKYNIFRNIKNNDVYLGETLLKYIMSSHTQTSK